MTQFAIGGILTTSTFPLRLVVYVALPLCLIDLGAIVMSALSRPFWGDVLLNINLVFFVSTLAVIAVYLSRVYKDSARRPIFIVDVEKSVLPDPIRKSESRSIS